jgi:hypothetical protein
MVRCDSDLRIDGRYRDVHRRACIGGYVRRDQLLKDLRLL